MAYKRCISGVISVLMALLLAMTLIPTAVWADSYDSTKLAAIKIQLQDLGTPMSGVKFACYQVGQLTTGTSVEWELVAALKSEITLDLNDLHTASSLKQAALDLKTAVAAAKITGVEATSDSTGLVEFTNLAHGVYLIVQTGTASYGTCEPFLAAVPYTDDNSTWQYTLQVTAKGVRLPTPTPDDSPDTPPTPTPTPTPGKLPKTGDSANLTLWGLLAGGACLGLVVTVLWKRVNRKGS